MGDRIRDDRTKISAIVGKSVILTSWEWPVGSTIERERSAQKRVDGWVRGSERRARAKSAGFAGENGYLAGVDGWVDDRRRIWVCPPLMAEAHPPDVRKELQAAARLERADGPARAAVPDPRADRPPWVDFLERDCACVLVRAVFGAGHGQTGECGPLLCELPDDPLRCWHAHLLAFEELKPEGMRR